MTLEPFGVGERRDVVEEFASAYARSKLVLIRTAALITGNDEVAADIVAEVFARVLPRWRAGNIRDLDGYLYQCVVNECMSALRRRRTVERRNGPGRLLETSDPAQQVADHELVAQLLATLKPKVRTMVVLRFFLDLTEAQTADLVGVPVGTVKFTVSRALDA